MTDQHMPDTQEQELLRSPEAARALTEEMDVPQGMRKPLRIVLYAAAALLRTALEPRLLGRQMGLDPLLTLLSLYAGFHFFGVPGMILFPMALMFGKQVLH